MAIEPVHQGESGAKVATLHRGLLYLIRNQRGIIAETRNALEQMLANDVATQSFGWATTSAVGIFQYQFVSRRDIPKEVKKEYPVPILRKDDGTGNGDVDDATAGSELACQRNTRSSEEIRKPRFEKPNRAPESLSDQNRRARPRWKRLRESRGTDKGVESS